MLALWHLIVSSRIDCHTDKKIKGSHEWKKVQNFIKELELRQSGRGYIVVLTDGLEKVIRYPIRLPKFKEQPKFYQKEKKGIEKSKQISEERKSRDINFKLDFLKELLFQIKKKKQNQEPKKKYRVRSKGKKRK